MTSVYVTEGAQEEGILSVFKEFAGLTVKEIEILALLINNNGMVVANLAGITGFDYTTTKEILRSLKDKGLVKSNRQLIPSTEVA